MNRKHPYHEGELAVQKLTNKTLFAQINGLLISEKIPHVAMRFIAQQPMAVIGSIDAQGQLWASILFGSPGFLCVENERELKLDKTLIDLSTDDPLWKNIRGNDRVGMLIIDLGSRQRLRVNGRVFNAGDERIAIAVDQSYPNCPKYIQQRKLIVGDKTGDTALAAVNHGTVLTKSQQALIGQADTLFVASGHPEYGVDASHRGGQPGFIEIIDDTCLQVPDYEGNNMFNTLGNLHSYPFAGLLLIDFQHQRLLQLTGSAEILWNLDDTQGASEGSKRFWQFHIRSWREYQPAVALSWEFLGYSPFNPAVAKQPGRLDLPLRVEKITELTPRVKSFVLRGTENQNLPAFEPGAHLPLQVVIQGQQAMRHYSLISDHSDTRRYEIAVLEEAEGRGGSFYLHHRIHEGDILTAQTPKNEFPMADKADHSLFIAGGIGITPLVSMLRRLSLQKQSFEIHYVARTHRDFALLDTVKSLAGARLFCYTSREHESNTLNLQALLASPKAGTQLYVCGPARMIEAVRDTAESNHWPPERVHFESFGAKLGAGEQAFTVHLSKSQKTIQVPENRSILDTLLNEGINVPHSCIRGECAMCLTRVLGGEPDHRDLCLDDAQRKTSMCVCISRARSEELLLEL